MLAVTLGHLESARTLLQHSTNVNTENRDGWTGEQVQLSYYHENQPFQFRMCTLIILLSILIRNLQFGIIVLILTINLFHKVPQVY